VTTVLKWVPHCTGAVVSGMPHFYSPMQRLVSAMPLFKRLCGHPGEKCRHSVNRVSSPSTTESRFRCGVPDSGMPAYRASQTRPLCRSRYNMRWTAPLLSITLVRTTIIGQPTIAPLERHRGVLRWTTLRGPLRIRHRIHHPHRLIHPIRTRVVPDDAPQRMNPVRTDDFPAFLR